MNWLLLRGLMREQDHWGEFKEMLEKMPGVNRVLCLDLAGVGTESSRIFYPQVKEAVEDIRSRFKISKEDSDEEWGILGISLGGMIAMQWVHTHPYDFKKIIVMNSSSRDFPAWKRLMPTAMKAVGQIFLDNGIAQREKKIIDLTTNLKKNDLKLMDSWVKIAQKNPISKMVAVSQLAAAAQFILPPKISIPMLVLASRADRMVNYECSKGIAHKYRAEIRIHSTAGHDISVDDPSWVVEQIQNWK